MGYNNNHKKHGGHKHDGKESKDYNKYNQSNSEEPRQTLDQKTVELFAQIMIDRMEQMKSKDWKKGWIGGTPFNGVPQSFDGRKYHGINNFMLFINAQMNGYKTPVYTTLKKANEKGFSIKKGEQSFPVMFWGFYYVNKIDGSRIKETEYNKLSKEEKENYLSKPYPKAYRVFNIDQTTLKEVNPKKYEKLVKQFEPDEIKDTKGMYVNKELDRLFEKQEWVCPIQVDKESSRAFYRPSTDNIVIPMKEQFNISKTPEEIYKDGMEYYSTTLHEMAHSTGAPNRLNRDKGGAFGDEKYAKEELVAELTAALVGYSIGFDSRITDNNAAYLDSWINALEENRNFITSVLADVNKASNMIIEYIDKQRLALGMEPLIVKVDENNKQQSNSENATEKEQKTASQQATSPSEQTEKTKIHDIEKLSINFVNEQWQLSATIDNVPRSSVAISETDVLNYKHGIIDQQALVRKAFGDITTNSHSLPDKQETVHARRR